MHDDEDGGVEHMSARDLEAERRLKLCTYLWMHLRLSAFHILDFFFLQTYFKIVKKRKRKKKKLILFLLLCLMEHSRYTP